MSDCIFCQIASGKISCHKIFEDDSFIGFLDISPVIAGHVLIIPKKHYRWVHEVEEFGKFWEAAQKVAKAQIKGLKVPTVVFATAGIEVPHAHIHVLPMPKNKNGEYLPGIESARRLNIPAGELQKTASLLRAGL
jgi:histidine triad (HIT) family protein